MTNDIEHVIQVPTAADLLRLLRQDAPQWGDAHQGWLFRGQSDGSRPLVPTAYREEAWLPFRNAGQPPHEPTRPYSQQPERHEIEEAVLLTRFVYACDAVGLPVPEYMHVKHYLHHRPIETGIFADPAVQAAMALAQHHGVPTRLLDFTRSPTHAAYFAATGAARKYAEGRVGSLGIWGVSISFLLYVSTHANPATSLPVDLRIVTTASAPNLNLQRQLGVFLLWWHNAKGVRTLDLRTVLNELAAAVWAARGAWQKPVFIKLELPWSEAPALCRMLAAENVDGARMFAGYDGVVRGLKERTHWDRFIDLAGSTRDGFF